MDIIPWLSPLGLSVRLISEAFRTESFRNLRWKDFSTSCAEIGLKSFHMVAICAVFVATALVMQCAFELQKYRSQDISGAVISIGLLREVGPLTIGLAWSARVAALVSGQAQQYANNNRYDDFGKTFVLSRFLATVAMAVPLSVYGVTIGFLTGAFVAPLFGVSSTTDFLESARLGIQNIDLVAYFVKLIFIFPFVSVLSGSTAGITSRSSSSSVATNAVTATFIMGYFANLLTSMALFYR